MPINCSQSPSEVDYVLENSGAAALFVDVVNSRRHQKSTTRKN